MRLIPNAFCLGSLLSLMLAACQSPQPLSEPAPLLNTDPTSSYLFSGNPGIATTSREDITGTMTGTIDGQPVAFGPDKATLVRATTGYDPQGLKASILSVSVQNEQYNISLGLRGPFEAGRSYQLVNTGQEQFDPYTVIAAIRPRLSVFSRDVAELAPRDKQVRITALTADYIDLEFSFTFDKPGASPERLAVRVKNVLDENRTVRSQSETAPFWDYTKVSRLVEGYAYSPQELPFNEFGYPPQTTRVLLQQQVTTPITEIVNEGKTEYVSGQRIMLAHLTSPLGQIRVEYLFQTKWTDKDWKWVEIAWPNFKGVGTYTGDEVTIQFTNSQGDAGYWRVRTDKLTGPTTRWQVDVQTVTPDVIEGTYTVVNAPLNEKSGAMTMPASANVSGRFKVIYPR